jgi:hypothetical protein
LGRDEILGALRKGNFMISSPYFELDPRGDMEGWSLAKIIMARRIYIVAKKISYRMGLTGPP